MGKDKSEYEMEITQKEEISILIYCEKNVLKIPPKFPNESSWVSR